MIVRINDDGTIECGPIKEDMAVCYFWSVWNVAAQCGNCPLITFGEEYLRRKFEL